MPGNIIQIPMYDSNEVVEIGIEELPDSVEILSMLEEEFSQFHVWIDVALGYYKLNKINDFIMLIEIALERAYRDHVDYETDRMRALDLLAAHYVQQAYREKSKDKKLELLKKATNLYTITDKAIMYERNHLLGRAYFSMLEGGGKMDQANTQFNFILNQLPENVPSLLGKACIAFNKKNYRGALAFYAKVLLLNPNGPADIRLGMAHCFLKLKNPEKALLAFERALQLDAQCVSALIGLAIPKLTSNEHETKQLGIEILSKAYCIDSTNPMVLNHLANHFFLNGDYKKMQHLALHAFHNTENDAMRAESCYHLARSFHVECNYEQAFQYYYQSTQLAPANFVLPHYGLGQMYINRGDACNATQCFEKILKIHPESYETMKILGSLYASSVSKTNRDLAKTYLKKYTEENPYDCEAWIELAQLLEENNWRDSLNAYESASTVFKENLMVTVPVEILTNIAALHYRLGNLQIAKEKQTEALENAKVFALVDSNYYNSISVTMKYNLARLNEAMSCHDVAENIYKEILKEHPNYIDCYLRLGCMARDKGLIFVASDFLKDALNIQRDNPEARSILGNLHLAKMQYAPGQKNFETILNNPATSADAYSLIALGNFSLQMIHQYSHKDKERKHEDKALAIYKQVLRNDPHNIWATNGIGCVLAHKGHISEARDIFSQVREATADFSDVWLNIAHVYVEQNQFINAIQMYENCINKFYQHHNVEVMIYLARAYMRANKLEKSKAVLLKARHVAPHDHVLLFNIAIVISKLAMNILKDHKSTLDAVLQAVHELELAQRNFQYLLLHGDRKLFNIEAARFKSNQCKDLISQAQYHVGRVRQIDAQEKRLRQKQEEDRNAFRRKQEEERIKREEMQKFARIENFAKRQEFMEKYKNIIISEPKPDKKRKRRRKDDYISNTDEDDAEHAPPRKRKAKGKRKKRRGSSDSGGGDSNKENRPSNRKNKKISERELSSKQHLKTIISSDSESVSSRSVSGSTASQSHHGRKRSHTPNSSDSDGAIRQKQHITHIESCYDPNRSIFGLPSPLLSNNCSRSRTNSHSRSRSRSGSAYSKPGFRSCSRSRSGSARSKSSSRYYSRSRSRSRSKSRRRSNSRSRSGSRRYRSSSRSYSSSCSGSPLSQS